MRSHHLRTANPSVGTPYDPLASLNDLAYGGFFSGGGLSNPIDVGSGGDTTRRYQFPSGWYTYGGMWIDPNPTSAQSGFTNIGGNTNAKGRIIQMGASTSGQSHGKGCKFMEWDYAGSNYSPSSTYYKYQFNDSYYYQRTNGSYFSQHASANGNGGARVAYLQDGTPVWIRTDSKYVYSPSFTLVHEVYFYSYPYPAGEIGRMNLSIGGTNEPSSSYGGFNFCFSGHQILVVQTGSSGGSTYVWGYDLPVSTSVYYSGSSSSSPRMKPMSSSYDALNSVTTSTPTTRWTFPGKIKNGRRRDIVFTGDGIVGNITNAGDLAYVRLTGVDFAGSGMNGGHTHVRNLSCFDTHGYGQIAMDYQSRTLVHYEYGSSSRRARLFYD